MKKLISRPNHNLILILLCGFIFLTSANAQDQSSGKFDEFFPTSDVRVGLNLPVLIDYSNEERTKPFDTYQVGLDINIGGSSKEIFPNTKLGINVGMFTILSLKNSDIELPEYHVIGSVGIEAGTSLIFKDKIHIGASLPLGFGNTLDAPYTYRTIVGITPNIHYVFKSRVDKERIFIKCQFPIWRNALRPPSPGLIIGIGLM